MGGNLTDTDNTLVCVDRDAATVVVTMNIVVALASLLAILTALFLWRDGRRTCSRRRNVTELYVSEVSLGTLAHASAM